MCAVLIYAIVHSNSPDINIQIDGNKGEIQYSGADRSYWWNRWKDLTEKFGKGKTRQITQAYLDEIEDIHSFLNLYLFQQYNKIFYF